MKATTLSGVVLDIRPGANVCGEAFVSVELTAKDFADERVFEWLREVVAVRLVAPLEFNARLG